MKSIKTFARSMNIAGCYVISRLLSSLPVMGTKTTDETFWNPMQIFHEDKKQKYAVIILNEAISLSKDVVLPIFKEARIRVTVDGGTDRWLQYLGPLEKEVSSGKHPELRPHMITGDFDSVRPDSLEKFRKLGVSIIETPDQLHTDFSKALMQLSAMCISQNITLDAVYVFAEHGGRFDQVVGNINTLYKSQKLMGNGDVEKVILISKSGLTWLLRAGKHRIQIPESLQQKQSSCGLIPFGCAARVSTTGLKWNLCDGELAFGGMVSTSNTYDGSPEVTVTTDSDIVWTMEIGQFFEAQKRS